MTDAAATTLIPATVADAFAAAARRWPELPFICVLDETARLYGIPAGETTYGDALRRIEAMRDAYRAAGYRSGLRVGLQLENQPDFLWHWFALNGLGVSVVPINAELRAAELGYLIGHSEICLAVATPGAHAVLRLAAGEVGHALAVIGPGDAPPPAPAAPQSAAPADPLAQECALLYTSGTTGRPKGCVLSNDYFLRAGRWYAESGAMSALRPGEERMLTPLPLVHMNAMAYSTLAMMVTGGCLILLDRFHPDTWWQSVRAARATVVHYLGVMPAMLMKAAPDPADAQHRVRFGFGAGAGRELHADFEARFGFPLLEAWAMTETGAGAVVIANDGDRKVGSNCFGREAGGVELRLVDDAGGDAAAGAPGELWVRHAGADPRAGFFSAYLKDPEATAQAWENGWFHTGDIVVRDAEGDLHFIDRRKNVIRRSGENISAVEVENVLQQHPGVRSVAVAAVPDALRGDEVLACVMVAPGVTPSEALARDIVQRCLGRLAYYKAPGFVAFVEQLPLTASQKIQRAELRTLAAAQLGTARCIDTRAMKKRQP